MSSVEQAVRAGQVQKTDDGRFVCEDCHVYLEMRENSRVGWHRTCPNCGRTWKQIP